MTNTVPPDIKPLQPYFQEQDIDLIDIWLMLNRRRRAIFLIIAIALLGGFAVIYGMAPVFESRAVVQVGRIGSVGAIEPAGALIERLREQYRVNDNSEGTRELPLISAVQINKGQQDIFTITARGHTAEEAKNYLESVVATLQREHEALLQEATQLQRARLDLMNERVNRARQQVQAINTSIESLKTGNQLQTAILLQEKSKILQELPTLEQEVASLTLSLSRLQTVPTMLLRDPTVPVKPLKPRPVLYLGIALIIGLVTAIGGAFFIESLSVARRRLRPTS